MAYEGSESVIEVNTPIANNRSGDASGEAPPVTGDQVAARSPRSERGKGRREWINSAFWILIIVGWCVFRLVGSCIPLTCIFDGASKCDRENDSDTVRGS